MLGSPLPRIFSAPDPDTGAPAAAADAGTIGLSFVLLVHPPAAAAAGRAAWKWGQPVWFLARAPLRGLKRRTERGERFVRCVQHKHKCHRNPNTLCVAFNTNTSATETQTRCTVLAAHVAHQHTHTHKRRRNPHTDQPYSHTSVKRKRRRNPTTDPGGQFDGDELTRVSIDTAHRLDDNVLSPMERWRVGHATVTVRGIVMGCALLGYLFVWGGSG